MHWNFNHFHILDYKNLIIFKATNLSRWYLFYCLIIRCLYGNSFSRLLIRFFFFNSIHCYGKKLLVKLLICTTQLKCQFLCKQIFNVNEYTFHNFRTIIHYLVQAFSDCFVYVSYAVREIIKASTLLSRVRLEICFWPWYKYRNSIFKFARWECLYVSI